ncbi:carbohydrate esterase family 16 protein [Xylariaceae sp. FL0016]|nr:carbohydrate esterase family 16 protein [Xylariaceae sp. FL0016]
MRCILESPLTWLVTVSITRQASARYVQRPSFSWDDTKYLIAFGDSYTFVQGTEGYPEYSFIGSYLEGEFSFTPEKLLSDRIVQNFNGTAEGGPNWVEFLTGCAAENGEYLPHDCKIQLWDFAFAGADVSIEFLEQHHESTVPLVNQTQQYLNWAEPVIGKKMDKSKALVAVWIGINDIIDSAELDVSFPEFYDDLISAVFEQTVQPMFDADYKNFLFINLPPLDRTSANVMSDSPSPSKEMIGWWDDALAQHSRRFSVDHPNANTMLYDANTFLNGVLDEPEKYDIKDTTTYCLSFDEPGVQTNPEKFGCHPLDDYFWFNSAHMTSHTHEVMTSDLRKFLQEQSC